MTIFLILSVVLLSFANGANDNFKGVATLWGAGLTTYQRAIAWGTGFTFLGSLGAIWLGSALAAKFSETKFVEASIAAELPFLIAVALGLATCHWPGQESRGANGFVEAESKAVV